MLQHLPLLEEFEVADGEQVCFTELCEAVAHYSALKSLTLSGISDCETASDCGILMRSIMRLSSLPFLDIGCTAAMCSTFSFLSQQLQSRQLHAKFLSSLLHLYVADCPLGNQGAEALEL